MFMLWKNCGWEMELNHHGMSPDRSTTDCATIQPTAGLFIFIYVLLQVRTQQEALCFN
ncbi:unnamed protein product [Meloidogyne enterolobii]|uniref:Uncharacterized protein n=1 Tax=Meloidogyne enterolobii TaxID=390850 RepID=A0ACB0Z0Z5_MELEN